MLRGGWLGCSIFEGDFALCTQAIVTIVNNVYMASIALQCGGGRLHSQVVVFNMHYLSAVPIHFKA